MKLILVAVLCSAAIVGQISPASAQYYQRGYGGPPGGYYGGGGGYDDGPGVYPQTSPNWTYDPHNQPMGYGEPYAPTQLANGRLACAHRNYRPIQGFCQRVW